MRRLTLSLLLLALLGLLSLGNSALLRSVSAQLNETLAQAEAAAEQGDWETAQALTQAARDKWEDCGDYLYIVLPHDYTDQVSVHFQEALELLQWGETAEYAAASGRLMAAVDHLSEAQALTLRNLL